MKPKIFVMRFAATLLLISLIALVVVSCGPSAEERARMEKGTIKVGSENSTVYQVGGRTITSYVIDSCEYLGELSGGYDMAYLTHKGNCKFCKQRKQ